MTMSAGGRKCETCFDKGFVNRDGEVMPCPNCNEDSGYVPGEYQRDLVRKHGRCGYAKGGGGRTCPLPKGHKVKHVFQCGR